MLRREIIGALFLNSEHTACLVNGISLSSQTGPRHRRQLFRNHRNILLKSLLSQQRNKKRWRGNNDNSNYNDIRHRWSGKTLFDLSSSVKPNIRRDGCANTVLNPTSLEVQLRYYSCDYIYM